MLKRPAPAEALRGSTMRQSTIGAEARDGLFHNTAIGPSVVYRSGLITDTDYVEAIASLEAARSQLKPNGRNCAICGDSGHQADGCHHNPLLMARRAISYQHSYRCFHCRVVFFTDEGAREHFGEDPTTTPACKREP